MKVEQNGTKLKYGDLKSIAEALGCHYRYVRTILSDKKPVNTKLANKIREAAQLRVEQYEAFTEQFQKAKG